MCDDPCCNPNTCQLINGAVCSSREACCSSCQVIHAPYIRINSGHQSSILRMFVILLFFLKLLISLPIILL